MLACTAPKVNVSGAYTAGYNQLQVFVQDSFLQVVHVYCMRHVQAACISQITKQSLATASPLVSLSPPLLVVFFPCTRNIPETGP